MMQKYLTKGIQIFEKDRRSIPKSEWKMHGIDKVQSLGRLPIRGIEICCAKTGIVIPPELRKAMQSLPVRHEFLYELHGEDALLSNIFSTTDRLYGGFKWFNFQNMRDFEEDFALANQYHAKECDGAVIPFIKIGNGDTIAVQVKTGAIWYLNVSEYSNQIASTLMEFYDAWSKLAYIGPEFWFLDHFVKDKKIQVDSELAVHLLTHLEYLWSQPVKQSETNNEECDDEDLDPALSTAIENALLGKGSWDEVHKISGYPLTVYLDTAFGNPKVGDTLIMKEKETLKEIIRLIIQEVIPNPVCSMNIVQILMNEEEKTKMDTDIDKIVTYEIIPQL